MNYYRLKTVLFLFAMLPIMSIMAQTEEDQISGQQPSKLIEFDRSANLNLSRSQDVLQKELTNGQQGYAFEEIGAESDRLGYTYQIYQETYLGLKVEFAIQKLHAFKEKLTTLSGDFYTIEGLDVNPSIDAKTAFNKAVEFTGAIKYMWEDKKSSAMMGDYQKPTGELLILPDLDNSGKVNLAYKFDIYATQPLSRDYVYISATTGQILMVNPVIKHLGEFKHSGRKAFEEDSFEAKVDALAVGNAATRYSGSRDITTRIISGNYALRDDTRGNGVNTYNSQRSNSYSNTNFFDNDNNWTAAEHDNANKDNGALDAHWGAESTYDYWSAVHNRNSFNGSGAAINSYVHYDNIPGGVGYDNAFWNGSVMTYGDGNNFDILTSLDVAAHEIGHAVTTFTGNMAYRRESGALNEGYSDVWAAAVEHFTRGGGSDSAPLAAVWAIGEDISSTGGLRSMSDPKSKGDPDTYRGINWRAATAAEGCITPSRDANDYCGVHSNSGVLNHWFYILVAGKTGTNDIGDSYSVTGVGMTKAGQIAYRLIRLYLSSNSTFADARTFGIRSAEELFGVGSPEVIETTNAWYAVGVGAEYGGGGGEPTACTTTISSFPYAESFESSVGWTQVTSDDGNWVRDSGGTPSSGTGPSNGAEGSFYMFLEASTNGSTGQIGANATAILESNCIDLSGESSASLSFNYHMFGTSVGSMAIQTSDDNGATWTNQWSLSGNQGDSWMPVNVSLNAFTGETIKIRIVGTTGTSWSSDIAVDNVKVTTGGSTGGSGCSGGISSFPYGESFEGGIGSWIQASGDDGDWVRDANGTPSSSTGPASALDGSFYLFLEASTNGSTGQIGSNATAILESTCLDFSGVGSASISFGYHMYGSNMGSLELQSSTDNGTSWSTIWSASGNKGNSWLSANVSLTVGSSEKLRFRGTTGNGWSSDLAIDNISITASSTATSFASLDNSSANAFQVNIYPNPVTGSSLQVSSNNNKLAYEIINSSGQYVGKGNVENGNINIESLSKGVYVLRISSGAEIANKRFIKQ